MSYFCPDPTVEVFAALWLRDRYYSTLSYGEFEMSARNIEAHPASLASYNRTESDEAVFNPQTFDIVDIVHGCNSSPTKSMLCRH